MFYVKNLKNAFGSSEIGTACGGASTRKIRSVLGGERVMRLRLGWRVVNLLPLAQPAKTLTKAEKLRPRKMTSLAYRVLLEI